MTRYVVVVDNGELGGAFGELGRVEARTPKAALAAVLRESGVDDFDAPYLVVPDRHFHYFSGDEARELGPR